MSAAKDHRSFDELLGPGRGVPHADRLDAAEPSEGARRQLERLLGALSHGELDSSLAELAGSNARVDAAPLLAELDGALATALARCALADRKVSVSEFLLACSLPADLFERSEPLMAVAQAIRERLRAARDTGVAIDDVRAFCGETIPAAAVRSAAEHARSHPEPIFDQFPSPDARQLLVSAPMSVEDWCDAMTASFSDLTLSEPLSDEDRDFLARAFRASLYQTARARTEHRENHPASGRFHSRFKGLPPED